MSRIAVLSTAHVHSRMFLKTLQEQPGGLEVPVIWDDIPERGQAHAKEFNCTFNPDLAAVLGDSAVAGFVICAENNRHLPLLEKALAAGRPVMCEKPLATTVADARAVAALVRRHHPCLTNGYFQPFNAGNRGVMELLARCALGKVTHTTFRNAHNAAYGRWFDSPDKAWFAQPELSGGGALLDMGTHAVHLLRWLFGPVREVWAVTGNWSGHYAAVDDYGLLLMRFASGVLGRVEAGWVFTGAPGGLEVIGSEKSLWNTPAGLVWGAPGQKSEPVPAADAHPDRIPRLLAAIAGKLDPAEQALDLAAALDSVAIMASAYASAKSGHWEPVEVL